MTKLVEVNPNLKIGIAFDTHAPQEFNVTLFDDKSGVAYKRQTDNFDMRTYANEILECLFARDGKTSRSIYEYGAYMYNHVSWVIETQIIK